MSVMKKDKKSNDVLMLAIQEELDRIVAKETCDASNFGNKSATDLGTECRIRKNVVMDVFLSSIWIQRLYFIIRVSIMTAVNGLLTYVIVNFLGVVNVFELGLIAGFAFVISLIVSRLFDKPTVKLSSKIIVFLKNHRKIREFILNRL